MQVLKVQWLFLRDEEESEFGDVSWHKQIKHNLLFHCYPYQNIWHLKQSMVNFAHHLRITSGPLLKVLNTIKQSEQSFPNENVTK